MTTTRVALVKAKDYVGGTRDLFARLEAPARLREAQRVVVKINLVRRPPVLAIPLAEASPRRPLPYTWRGNRGLAYTETVRVEGDVTRVEHVEALIAWLQDVGVNDSTICEGACGWDTSLAYEALGFNAVGKKYGVNVVDTNWADPTVIPICQGKMLKDLGVAKEYVDADFRINVTTLKVHGATCVSLCLKNWAIGGPPAIRYGINRTGQRIHGTGDSFPIHQHYDRDEIYGQGVGIAHTIADVNAALPYDLGIIDGMTTVHYGRRLNLHDRPAIQGRLPVVPTNLLFAICDRVAIDAVASRVLRLNP